MALSVLLMRLTGLMQLAANVAITSMYTMVCWMAWVNGGLMGTSIVWFATVPFAAIFIAGRRAGYVWAVLTLLALMLFMLLHNDPGALPEIPIPAIAEVQMSLAEAAETVSGESGADLKRRMRTGTVVTTDDRNWELRYSDSALRFSQSRAIAIDMESATIAAQGYRFRVPYGTLLCVSDKPLHGELKLPGQANQFYEEAIAAHLQIGIHAIDRLRAEGARLHSRKLRAFNEPPFR